MCANTTPLGRPSSSYESSYVYVMSPQHCRYEPDECVYAESVKLYGPNTLSVSVATEALSFFAAAAGKQGLPVGVLGHG